MMNYVFYINNYLIPFLLTMSFFSPALNNSRGGEKLRAGVPMRSAIIFAVIATIMFLLGRVSSSWIGAQIHGNGNWVLYLMTFFAGFRIFWHGIKGKAALKVFDITRTGVVAGMATVYSINALFIGVALGFADVSLFFTALIIALFVWLFSFSGFLYGNQFSENMASLSEKISGFGLMVSAGFLYVSG